MPEQAKKGPPAAVLCGDLNMLRCFVGRSVPVVVVASDPQEVTLRSRYCHDGRLIPSASESPGQAVQGLEAIGRSFVEPPVLFYGNDSMLLLVSRHRERLGRFFRFRLPDPDLVEALVDKARFGELSERHRLPVPKTLDSAAVQGASDILERLTLPCVLKPKNHTGWHASRAALGKTPTKALRADTPQELEAAYREASEYTDAFIIQEYVAGTEQDIYSYHAYVGEGSVPLGHFAGRKIRTYPREAGVSTYLELVKDQRVLALGASIVEAIGLVGPVKIDFKRDPESGELYVLELNPRFTLWNYLGAASGVNLPKIAYADLTGERCALPEDYRTGIRWLSFGNDFRSFLREYRPSGRLGWVEWLKSYDSRLIFDVFSWRDPLPFGLAMAHYVKALTGRLRRSPAAV